MPLEKIDPRQRAWVEVFPKAIKANSLAIKALLKDNCLLMAVVKADGYGHGSETVADAALAGGADNLGVATLQEALDLRKAGINCQILILGNLISSEELASCLYWDLTPTICSAREAKLCQQLAQIEGKIFSVHLKVDTGMTRLGCDVEDAFDLIDLIDKLPNLLLKGIYSHLALADMELNDKAETFTSKQKEKFQTLLSKLKARKTTLCTHLANSAGTFRDQKLHFDMVRVGLALYGYSPFQKLKKICPLEPALAVRARVTFVRDVPSRVGVSYGHDFVTERNSRLAVVGIGYADGINRALSGKISVLINGDFYPQVGSITMDQLVIDITGNFDIEVGDVVTLLGVDGNCSITPYQWSEVSGSIPWEILCGFKYRLPRVVI
ncbi:MULTISPECIES: alanine racemase [unclassified Prochlorococcus]|uniref:alanine racemase n=1 Tax=unclassified Prochlorococcus TaxID=2627481 RepID=UPI00053393FC|nr:MULTISPECIES: alanine racemase [unclassified Prochlorococcus]KGG15863.1 Alanine racemase [Prochlorococcus sp. MIT 0603]